jgi:hypothetical protein
MSRREAESTEARPGVRSNFGPVPLAYRPQVKARFVELGRVGLHDAIFPQIGQFVPVAEFMHRTGYPDWQPR